MATYSDDIKAIALDSSIPLQDLNGNNILVTGATGLIGSCLVKVLLSNPHIGYNVYAMGRSKERGESLFRDYVDNVHFHFISQDILKPLSSDIDFHYIIHAASNASPSFFVTTPVEIVKSNIIGLSNLFDYGICHNLKRLLYVSSGEVYGQGDGRVFDESYSGYVDCTSLRSCYPSSKRAAESMCVAYINEYGVDAVIARPCHVYGPEFSDNDNRAFAQFIRNAVNGSGIVLKSSGEQYRSWCYVTDCVSALLTILLKGECGQAYNVADSNSNVSIRTMAETIASISGRKVIIENPSSNEKMGYNVVTKSVYDVAKLQSLGWKARTTLYDGLKHSIEWLI